MRLVPLGWSVADRQARTGMRSWWVAACAAMLLHAGLWWAWQAVRQGALPGPSTHWAGLPSVHGGAVQLRLLASSAAQDGAKSRVAVAENWVPDALLASLPPPAAGPAAAGHQGVATTYLPAESLSDSPRPDPGWLLDEEALASVRQARLTMRLWVSAEGRIDRVALLSAEPAGDWAERAVQRLPDTPMLPGLKDGRAVPSTLVVEIASEIERFR